MIPWKTLKDQCWFYCFMLSLLFPVLGQTQATDSKTLSSVKFEGLRKIKTDYLQRFISIQPGDAIDHQRTAADVQQLKNLAGVTNAHYRLDTIDQSIHLIFKVDEALTLFPIVNFGGVEGNIWYQLGFTDFNWLGRGMQLTAFYQNIDRFLRL